MFESKVGRTKNEIDIIADTDERLVFVECKTMIYDTTDIDKFKSALRNFSGTSTLGVLVTNDDVKKEKRKIHYEHVVEKCDNNHILTFNFSQYEHDNNHTLSLNSMINSKLNISNT